jgi:hypothetical protein
MSLLPRGGQQGSPIPEAGCKSFFPGVFVRSSTLNSDYMTNNENGQARTCDLQRQMDGAALHGGLLEAGTTCSLSRVYLTETEFSGVAGWATDRLLAELDSHSLLLPEVGRRKLRAGGLSVSNAALTPQTASTAMPGQKGPLSMAQALLLEVNGVASP